MLKSEFYCPFDQAELAVSDFSGNGAGILAAASTIASTFVLVFVAEWGDKSFFSTIGEFIVRSSLGNLQRSWHFSFVCLQICISAEC